MCYSDPPVILLPQVTLEQCGSVRSCWWAPLLLKPLHPWEECGLDFTQLATLTVVAPPEVGESTTAKQYLFLWWLCRLCGQWAKWGFGRLPWASAALLSLQAFKFHSQCIPLFTSRWTRVGKWLDGHILMLAITRGLLLIVFGVQAFYLLSMRDGSKAETL